MEIVGGSIMVPLCKRGYGLVPLSRIGLFVSCFPVESVLGLKGSPERVGPGPSRMSPLYKWK